MGQTRCAGSLRKRPAVGGATNKPGSWPGLVQAQFWGTPASVTRSATFAWWGTSLWGHCLRMPARTTGPAPQALIYILTPNFARFRLLNQRFQNWGWEGKPAARRAACRATPGGPHLRSSQIRPSLAGRASAHPHPCTKPQESGARAPGVRVQRASEKLPPPETRCCSACSRESRGCGRHSARTYDRG